MTYKALEDYFTKIKQHAKELDNMSIFNDSDYEEPLTSIYFLIRTPAVSHYPSHEHTVNLNWQEGARWYDVVWEVLKVLESSYGYDIKDKVFFNVHELNIEAEESHGDPDIAKQMFTKEVS